MRAFCIPGVFFIFAAFALLLIVSVSLPYIEEMDIARIQVPNNIQVNGDDITQLRLGIWSYCYSPINENLFCNRTGPGYSLTINDTATHNSVYIAPSWTAGLAVHPVACGVAFIALLLSLSPYIAITLIASLASFLAATLTVIAFAIDIALYVYFKDKTGDLGFTHDNTTTRPAFWLTFASLILLILAGFIVCCGRRRDRIALAAGSSKP